MKHLLMFSTLALFMLTLGEIRGQEPTASRPSGIKLQAKADVILRESPPNKWFYYKGDQIGVLNKGDEVIAIDEKVLGTLYGDFIWLKVGKVDKTTGKLATTGWVYAGEKPAGSSSAYAFSVGPDAPFIVRWPPSRVPGREENVERQKPEAGESTPRAEDEK